MTNPTQPPASSPSAISEPEPLDLSGDPSSSGVPTGAFEVRLYNPRPHEDRARRVIAYSLIGMMGATIIGVFVLVGFKIITVADIEKFNTITSPLVALVSAATGFYYGAKSNENKDYRSE